MEKKRKILLTVVLVLASGGVLTGGIYYTWLITPPGPPRSAEEGLKTIGSARYERMPEYRKTAYVEQTDKLIQNLPQDQRGELFSKLREDETAREAMGVVRMNTMYRQASDFAKASPQDRVKILDAAIDMQEQMGRDRREGAPRGGPDGPRRDGPSAAGGSVRDRGPAGPDGQRDSRGPGQGRHPGNFRERVKHFIQEGNPQRIGLMIEFRRAMQLRRQQRGLPDRRP